MGRGGSRAGAGRPRLLRNTITCNLNLDRKHLRIIDRVAKRLGTKSRSEAMRKLLENVDLDALQASP